jgi:hypothetical protein
MSVIAKLNKPRENVNTVTFVREMRSGFRIVI